MMNHKLHGLKKKLMSEDFNSFIHFFATFTGIFLIMTVLILQVMQYGVYASVNNSLKNAVANADSYVNMTMSAEKSITYALSLGGGNTSSSENSTTNDSLSSSSSSSSATVDDNKAPEQNTDASSNPDSSSTETSSSKGKRIDVGAPAEDFSMAANTNVIVMDADGNILNTIDSYSSLRNLKVNLDKTGLVLEETANSMFSQSETYHYITVPVDSNLYPEAAYVTIAINTTQLEEASQRYVKIVLVVMLTFWIVSIAASMYLAKWSRRPIQESYEKQKSFVENASHELRTPLAVLQNRLETLFRKPESTILDNSENIASSLDEVRNMRILTTNLLNLARRDDGITPELEEIGPEFFDETFENYSMIAEENEKTFIGTNQVTRKVTTDKTLLKQVMTILFDNAIKYTDDDGEISFEVTTTDRNLFLTVKDNGPGISDVNKKKIFDRFYRVDKARTRQTGGFGLGLSLAQQIVDSLKGKITVKDNIPKGTIFEVRL
ncbi:sensor histidine kinase [Streptococcus dentiloxodontae]